MMTHSQGTEMEILSTIREYVEAGGDLMAQGYLNGIEQLESSTWRELSAIQRVKAKLCGKILRLFTDNLAKAWLLLRGSQKDQIQAFDRTHILALP